MRILAAILVVALFTPLRAGDAALPFGMSKDGKAILVLAEVNGQKATLILDTGATTTILSPEALNLSTVELAQARFRSGPGMRGDALWAVADLRIGKVELAEHRVVVMDFGEIRREYGSKVQGLLGLDILLRFDRVVIDRRERLLRLERR